MKKLIQLLAVLLLAGFVLPSCNSSLGITKRRYTKGYFVQHNSGKHLLKKHNEVLVTKDKTISSPDEEFRATEFIKSSTETEPVIDKKGVITAAAPKAHTFTREEKKVQRDQAVDLAVKHPVKAIKKVGDLVKQDSGDKALSLLWVVIVVILIVYLLGLLLDWAGGGAWIHVLGIIALVLLILWLLRIL